MHFTHIDHVESMAHSGLVCDAEAHVPGTLAIEVGDLSIKERRRRLHVPAGPGGVVADYVPFYFAPRSPMMYVIDKGRVSQYQGPIYDLVYLVSSIERLHECRCTLVVSDRNASIGIAEFSANPAEWDELVDWDVMDLVMWQSTSEYPDRMERRMAECLARGHVPWAAIDEVVTSTSTHARHVAATLATLEIGTPVSVRRDWYF